VIFNLDSNKQHFVAFMSRKLKGAQYRYDARNVEALAAQVALQTWRTLLLGQKFEIYSDHDSLQYTQKSPSQRILRLCEFLSDFNFEEIEYVPGAHNVVPDFLSRPWDGTCDEVPAAIHVLAACTSRRLRKTEHPCQYHQSWYCHRGRVLWWFKQSINAQVCGL